jgi:hypothetical protein
MTRSGSHSVQATLICARDLYKIYVRFGASNLQMWKSAVGRVRQFK